MTEIKTKKWSRFEKIWLVLFSLIILSTTVYFNLAFGVDWSDTEAVILNWVISPVSALTGIVCVVLVARGNIRNYAWGLINCLTYGYVAYRVGYYGDMMLNWFFFVPFQFIGFYMWKKRLKTNSETQVRARRLTLKQWLGIIAISGFAIVAFGLILHGVDTWFTVAMRRNESIYTYLNELTGVSMFGPMFDSSTEVFQIIAQLLMVGAYAEQWPLWIVNNIITISMWVIVAFVDPSLAPLAIVTSVMWIAYLVNSIYGWYMWKKEAAIDNEESKIVA